MRNLARSILAAVLVALPPAAPPAAAAQPEVELYTLRMPITAAKVDYDTAVHEHVLKQGNNNDPIWVLSMAGQVVGVVDGDTVDVKIVMRYGNREVPLIVRVRLLASGGRGCWAGEVHRQSSIANAKKREAELERGLAGKRFTEERSMGKDVRVVWFVRGQRAIDSMSLERLLALVYLPGGKSLGDELIQAGHASSTKGGKPGR